ncbi:MAG: Maf family nucleotide pyrophosphatase [Ottowia sp.]|nr:Maf family nucleotide pyrophosphatase [Ottowia sp.]
MSNANAAPAGKTRPLILASGSRYRRTLLERLGIPFDSVAPQVDETPLAGETPRDLALRLACAKADAVAETQPQSLVIGSDQVLDLDGRPEGKPGTHARAAAQLQRLSGREVVFHTALAVCCRASGFRRSDVAEVRVRFRKLEPAEIERYLLADRPYDCAGSARSESLGIALLERMVSDDPTALIGLPLIRTAALLRAAGLAIP